METKVCRSCNQEKFLSEFYFKNRAKGVYHNQCKDCYKQYRSSIYPEYYSRKKQEYRDRNKKYILRNRKNCYDYLLKHSCVDCGESDPVVLEFDHLRDKVNNISRMIRNSLSWEAILHEIQKCEVVCANCHKRRTAKRGNWYKDILEDPVPELV